MIVLILLPLAVIGVCAPFGTTIFGAVAIAKIKRSGGKLYGLPLAFADMIFFPLLAVFFGIAWLVAKTISSLANISLARTEIPGALVSLVVCYFIVRSAWRAVAPAKESKPAAENVETPLRTFLRLMLWVVVLIGTVIFFWPNFVGRMDPNTAYKWQEANFGAADPWLVVGFDASGIKFVRPDFATRSALAGLCALVAGAALISTRRRSTSGAEKIVDKPRPGFLRHVVVPMLILLVLCSAIGTLCIAMFEKRDDTVLRMCWRVGSIVVPVAAALLLVRWARLRGIAGSIGAFVLRSLSLRSWTWPLAALVLVPAAIYIPHPGKLPEPKEVEEVFRPAVLLAPEGDSYHSYSFDEPDWTKLSSVVYIINRRIFDTQQVTRSFGWNPTDGMSLGFFHRSATWKYELTALQFGNKRDESKPVWLPDEEVAKLREKITLEMNLHDIRVSHDPARKSQMKEDEMYQRANRFVDILNNGRHAESVVCWQNLVVLLAWLSLPLAVLTLIWKLREIFVACIGVLGALLAVANGSLEALWQRNNLDWAAIPLMIIAAVGVAILFVLHCFERPAGIRAALPTFTLIALGASAGALPWMMAFVAPVPGWHLWHGVAFSLVYFALLLIHIIASGEKFARLRAVSLLAGGLAVIVLAFICTTWPPTVAASINGQPTTFIANVVLPGLLLAENLAFLTAIIGAVKLRQALAAKQNA